MACAGLNATARVQAEERSDQDVLVEFNPPRRLGVPINLTIDRKAERSRRHLITRPNRQNLEIFVLLQTTVHGI